MLEDMDLKELERRIKKGVRNIRISPLFEKDKHYNIDRESPLYEQEDPNGTLCPDKNHCWIDWEAKWIDYSQSESGHEKWSREVFWSPSLEKAEEVKKYLEKHLIQKLH